MINKIDKRLKKIFSNVFSIPISDISDNASPDNINKWDSIGHINFIIAIEEEFDIEFSDEEMMELLNYQLIKLSIIDISTK